MQAQEEVAAGVQEGDAGGLDHGRNEGGRK